MNRYQPPVSTNNSGVNGTLNVKAININGHSINEVINGPQLIPRVNADYRILPLVHINSDIITVNLNANSEFDELRIYNQPNISSALKYISITKSHGVTLPSADISGINNPRIVDPLTVSFNAPVNQSFYIWTNINATATYDVRDPEFTSTSITTPDYMNEYNNKQYIRQDRFISAGNATTPELRQIAIANKPCVVIGNTPQENELAVISSAPSSEYLTQYINMQKLSNNKWVATEMDNPANEVYYYDGSTLNVGTISSISGKTITGITYYDSKWWIAVRESPYLYSASGDNPLTITTWTAFKNMPYFTPMDVLGGLMATDAGLLITHRILTGAYIGYDLYVAGGTSVTHHEADTNTLIDAFTYEGTTYVTTNGGKLYTTTDMINFDMITDLPHRMHNHVITSKGVYLYSTQSTSTMASLIGTDHSFANITLPIIPGGFAEINNNILCFEKYTSGNRIYTSTNGHAGWTITYDMQQGSNGITDTVNGIIINNNNSTIDTIEDVTYPATVSIAVNTDDVLEVYRCEPLITPDVLTQDFETTTTKYISFDF